MITAVFVHGRFMVSRFRARHTKNGEQAVLVETPTLFTLDEAALALAIVYRDRGRNALQQGLGQAAAERVLERRRPKPVDGLIEHYRTALLNAGVFEG